MKLLFFWHLRQRREREYSGRIEVLSGVGTSVLAVENAIGVFVASTLRSVYLQGIFGILGVVLGMFIVATVGRVAHETLMQQNSTAPALLAMTVIVYQLILKFESSVGGMYAGIGFAIIPIYFIHRAVKLTLPTIRNDDPAGSGNVPPEPSPPSLPRWQSPST